MKVDQWRERNESLVGYIRACDNYVAALEELHESVRQLGSDPTGIMELVPDLDAVTQPLDIGIPVDEYVSSGVPVEDAPRDTPKLNELLQRAGVDPSRVAVEVAELPNQQMLEKEAEEARQLARKQPSRRIQRMKERAAEKNKEVVEWWYSQLVNGPIAATLLFSRAEKAGISKYRLDEARKGVSDIKSAVIGMRGPHYYYLEQDAHRLPKAQSIAREDIEGTGFTDLETKLMALLPATSAEMIGKTGFKPEKVKYGTERLRARKLITMNRNTKQWERL